MPKPIILTVDDEEQVTSSRPPAEWSARLTVLLALLFLVAAAFLTKRTR